MTSLMLIGFVVTRTFGAAPLTGMLTQSVGQPVDIAASAYQYRADRRPDANPPESWLALIHFALLPTSKALDPSNSYIRRCLAGMLWEEIRPVQTLELTWPSGSRRQPAPDKVAIDALINHGA